VTLAVLVLAGAGYCFVTAQRADDRAAATRHDVVRLRSIRRRVEAQTERVSHEADEPIGLAEKVSTSISRILGATGPVIDAANTAEDRLGHAVDVANSGGIAAARSLYANEVADAIRSVQSLLGDAQRALNDARTAALQLAVQGA
jgi:hypothetical protein